MLMGLSLSAELSGITCCRQSNPYIDDEAEDEDDDDDDGDDGGDGGSDTGDDSVKNDADDAVNDDDELSNAQHEEGPEASADDDAQSAESLHLYLDTEDVEDTQCKSAVIFITLHHVSACRA